MVAGGVFLAGSFVHLLPDALANAPLAELGCDSQAHCFPLAFFLYGVGFVIILLVEVGAHAAKDQLLRSSVSSPELLPLTVSVPTDKNRTCHGANTAHMHTNEDASENDNPTVVAATVFVALSFHSLMEGIGIGAAPQNAWSLLLAIVAHKSLAAMALALEMLHHAVPPKKIVAVILVFAAMSPIGVGVGYIVSGSSPADSLASGVCTALAGGTFLYVGAMEVLPEELRNKKHMLAKLAAFVLSFILFSILALWV
ncbi:Zinc (Zn2)-Iron (Fe2) Permease (ZIP) Family [Achlya hypogyna]|uniref:Zinc (Zn2)-Iron (Fe2) Permease (ZIP) Family n=1 Tax=Achlya hypogyna TaxID=1202772 RepID=A0A1V9YDA1_ACHHY|nr:Zinc (Zn2)-Iron (Fe2) Permease (ZIP) Family [Achlya hypogyna]